MTIETTDRTMTSDRTPEQGFRVAGAGAAVWRLTWLPEHRLTRAQARAGMELDELLSDPDAVHDATAQEQIAHHAATLGVRYKEVVLLLSRRMLERARHHSAGCVHRDGGAATRCAPGRAGSPSAPMRHRRTPQRDYLPGASA